MSSKKGPKLSKTILGMKFMKRTREKFEKEADDAHGRSMYLTEFTEKMMGSNSNFIIEPSYVFCENLIDGRFSFNGMNPEIEKILEKETAAKEDKKSGQIEREVGDKEMQEFYSNTVTKTMSRKFETKRKYGFKEQQASKKKFWRPNDD